MHTSPTSRRRTVKIAAALAIATTVAFAAAGASASAKPVKLTPHNHVIWMKGSVAPGTPSGLNRVGVLKIGPSDAKNVLILNPGTSAGAAYFAPIARSLVGKVKGWQVWSVERRENQIEDQSMLNKAKRGDATAAQVADYYLRWISDSSITDHYVPVPDSQVPYARDWGMSVEINDLRHVVRSAKKLGGKVVMGGHSLGGSITTAYATWDFNGKAGADDLSGLVYIDGASNPVPVAPETAQSNLTSLQNGTPWLAFGGIPAPYLGLFSAVGATGTKLAPNDPSGLQSFPLLPANLKPPVPATNEANFGYAIDNDTSPSNLAAAQIHGGHLAASGDPRGWDPGGDITPIQRYAAMLSGTNLVGVDGSAWYHPRRLTIDSGAVGDGNANPAQDILAVKATHGDDVKLPMYAFGAALGGTGVLTATQALATQSGVPSKDLTLIDRHTTYSHNDPSAALPARNDFLKHLVPFIRKIGDGTLKVGG